MAAAIAVPLGTKFGNWTVIGEGEQYRGQRRMLCECICGTRRGVVLGPLRNGVSKSCGCQRKAAPKGRRVKIENHATPRLSAFLRERLTGYGKGSALSSARACI